MPAPFSPNLGNKDMKTYEVLVKAWRVLLVEVEDDCGPEEAEEEASINFTPFNWEIDEFKVERELTTPDEIARAKSHGAEPIDNAM